MSTSVSPRPTPPASAKTGIGLSAKVPAEIVWIAGAALGVRLLLWLIYDPWWCGDSIWYSRVWCSLSSHDWHGYDGSRTPVYPAFLGFTQWLAGQEPDSVLSIPAAMYTVLIQQVLGITSAILVWATLINLGCRRRVAFAAGLFASTYVGLALGEVMVLPLALTSSFLVLGLWAATLASVRPEASKSRSAWAFLAGTAFGGAILTRPETLLYVLAFGGMIWFAGRRERKSWRLVALLFLGALPGPAAWTVFNGVNLGQFSLTTLTGLNMTSAVYNLWPAAPPEDAQLARMMLPYYRGPAHPDFACNAFNYLIENAGSLPIRHRRPYSLNSDLCAYLGHASWKLALRRPDVWMGNALWSLRETLNFHLDPASTTVVWDPRTVDYRLVVRWPGGQLWLFRVLWLQAVVMLGLYLLNWAIVLGARSLGPALDSEAGIARASACGMALTLVAFGLFSHYFKHYGVEFYPVFVIGGAWWVDAHGERVLRMVRPLGPSGFGAGGGVAAPGTFRAWRSRPGAAMLLGDSAGGLHEKSRG